MMNAEVIGRRLRGRLSNLRMVGVNQALGRRDNNVVKVRAHARDMHEWIINVSG